MKNDKTLSLMEPSENLRSSIIQKIKVAETKRTIYKIVFSSILSLTSIFVAIFSVTSIIKDIYQSGLFQYVSLIFSDGTSLISYWQTYIMSIAESLPVISMILVTTSILVFVWSTDKFLTTLKNMKSAFYKIN